MVALLVFIMANLVEKNCWTRKVYLAVAFSKIRLDISVWFCLKVLVQYSLEHGHRQCSIQGALASCRVSAYSPVPDLTVGGWMAFFVPKEWDGEGRFCQFQVRKQCEVNRDSSWLLSAYYFYSRVVKNRKRTSESSSVRFFTTSE